MPSSPTFTATIEKIVERTPDSRSFFLRAGEWPETLISAGPIPLVFASGR